MVSTRSIGVRKDDDLRVLEMSGIGVPPLAGAVRAACRRDAKLDERIYRLLAFGNEDWLLIGDGFDQRRQAIERRACITEFPTPAAIAIGSALANFFGSKRTTWNSSLPSSSGSHTARR